MTKALIAAVLLLAPVIAWADPGDTLYVQGNSVNVRSVPSTSAGVVMKLDMGRKLIEFERQNSWVYVGIVRAGGQAGWIADGFVGVDIAGGETVAIADRNFTSFENAVLDINERVRQTAGVDIFTDVENLGDGLVWVTATNIWVDAPFSYRETSLNTLFSMWDTAEGSGLPIMIQIVDQHGTFVMRMARLTDSAVDPAENACLSMTDQRAYHYPGSTSPEDPGEAFGDSLHLTGLDRPIGTIADGLH
jgi:hypothetical protein